MCGIVGVLYRDPRRPVSRAVLKDMGRAIAHRGPDAEGFFAAPGVGLVHRRLSIIDLAGGDQPIGNEDGSVQVVFNGEIYNFLRLRRDRVGLKPLYVYRDAEKLVFGSELKAVPAHPGVDRSLDAAAVEDYLAYGIVPGERSIFRHARKLAPGHVATIGPEALDRPARRYWQFQAEPDERTGESEWREALEAKLVETVAAHQIADVPVGAFLSGGVDSSVIVAVQSAIRGAAVPTFSIGFRKSGYSELPYARDVARQFGTEHTEKIVTSDAAASLDDLVHFYDEPFAEPAMWPWFSSPLDRRINRRRLLRGLREHVDNLPRPVVAVTTLPLVADLMDRLPVDRWVYYCVDDFTEWPGLDQAALRRMEETVVRRVDRLIAASETLRQRLARLGRSADLLTHGVDLELWRAAPCPAAEGSGQAASAERPLIVFWGLLDRRVDTEFLRQLDARMTEGTILLVGPESDPDPELLRLRRVVRVPAVPYAELPAWAAATDDATLHGG